MNKLRKSFKIFAFDPSEIKKERGNFPLQSIVPYGPMHESEDTAQSWLSEHLRPDTHYTIIAIFTSQKKNNDKT